MTKEIPKHVASMISELTRLSTFFSLISQGGINYNIRNGPIRLAKQGIFYHEECNILICYFCEKETDINELQNIIIVLHNSTCSFKDGSRNNSATDNVPIQHPDDEHCQLINNELSERYRVTDSNMSISRENSDQAPRDSFIPPLYFNNMNNNPFYLLPTNFTNLAPDIRRDIPESQPFRNNLSTQSNFSPLPPLSLPVPSNQTVDKPNRISCLPLRDSNSRHHRHSRESIDCGLKSEDAIPDRPYSKENRKTPDIPMMASYQNRLDTFKQWPHHSISPRDVSRAGLYMTGREDSVKCFTCNVILKKWKPTDDPFIEHRKWSPSCSYIAEKSSKNQGENISKEKHSLETFSTPDKGTNPMPSLALTSSEAESLREENEKLKNETTCRICLDNPAEILTLPCAHISSCASCAAALKKCPICRREIKGTVKVFLS